MTDSVTGGHGRSLREWALFFLCLRRYRGCESSLEVAGQVPGCPRRDVGKFNTFCPSRTRRGAENFNTFLSTEDTEEHGELQHLLAAEDTEEHGELLTSFGRGGHGGARRTSTPFCPRRTRRSTKNFNSFLSTEDTEGHGELQHLLAAEDTENFNTFCPRRAVRDAENWFAPVWPRRGAGRFGGSRDLIGGSLWMNYVI